MALLQEDGDPETIRRRSVEIYNAMASSVREISRLLVETKDLGRLQNVAPGGVTATKIVGGNFLYGLQCLEDAAYRAYGFGHAGSR